ncbi:MAG: potassium transporter TrkG [Bacteroidales bacterium]|nr:TrkH family potassium uptake protein [Bacteroidales bacterium]MBS3775133.1 TrkH family potassium uptake protein [Bacteroidales bacterium]
MINVRVILNILGLLLLIEGISMLLPLGVSVYYNEGDIAAIGISAGIAIATGAFAWLLTQRRDETITKKEGYIIVSTVWIMFSLFGCLPFVISGEIASYTNAFFETISGFTTTGASILSDVESLPHGLLFWRNMTQWLGGMGIIVLSLAILPIFGIGGMQLFVAEVPGPTPDKFHPRVKETAKRLWQIYVFFTITEIVLLVLGDVKLFDAVCHSFTTMATGGYSTKQASIAHFSPYVQYVITAFMFLAGTNFALSYYGLHLQFNKIVKNEEFRFYFFFLFGFTILITAFLWFGDVLSFEESFRNSLFQVVSITTTTGYVTTDYLQWAPFLVVIIFMLMFLGGSGGSTGGGIKIVRVALLIKNSALELKRLLHPNAVIPVRLNKKSIDPQIVTNVQAFVVLYMMLVGISTIIVSSMGYDLASSLGSVAATLGNIGPGIGAVGPVENYAHFPDFGKWFLSFLMLIGRLELFTVLILFAPAFYKK